MHRRAFLGWAIGAAAAAALGATGHAATIGGRWWSSLVFGLFENHGFDDVVDLPSHRRLATEGTVLARYFAITHPSGPNYRALISGETWSPLEAIDTFHPSIASLAAALQPPIPTYVYHLSGEIAHWHNPFLDLRSPVAAVRHGLQAFQQDIEEGIPSPSLVYVGWDDSNNMHNRNAIRADRNLSQLLDLLAASSWFSTPDGDGRYPALFFCYDEDRGRTNRVFAAWWGRGVRRGLTSQVPHTHYSFCRTVTENWGLPALGHAADTAPIAEPWR